MPLDRDRSGAALRMPPSPTDDGDRGSRSGVRAETNDALDAGQRERRSDVDGTGAAAEHRAMADRRVEHSGQADVAAEDRRAIALGDDVDPRRGAADQLPVLAPLQRHLAGGGRRSHLRELAVVRRVARGMADDAFVNDELAGRLLPGDRRGADETGARRRRGQRQHVPGVDDARRAAGDVDAELARNLGDDPLARFRRRALVAGLGLARMEVRQAGDHRRDVAVEAIGASRNQAHARQRHVEFLGDEHCQRRVHTLAHLAPVHGQQHRAVGSDLDPAVEADLAVRARQQVGRAESVARR